MRDTLWSQSHIFLVSATNTACFHPHLRPYAAPYARIPPLATTELERGGEAFRENVFEKNEKIKKEFESIGFFVGEHPLKTNLKILDQYKVISYLDLKNDNKIKDSMIAGTLISIQEKKTAKGNPYAIIKLVDLSTMYELFIFSEKLVDNRKKLIVGNSFLIKAKKETIFEIVPDVPELSVPIAIIAPTIITAEIALVTDIKGV